jgi:predicted esterase
MDYQPLHYIYRAAPGPATRTLLLLHGTGGDERDLIPLAQGFGSDFNVLSVRGNVLEGGMPRFFRRLSMGVFDEQDVQFRTHELVYFLTNLASERGFDLNELVALGYSNGANLIGSTLLLYPELLAGAILLRPMQPLSEVPAGLSSQRQTPVFFSNGLHDPTVNPAATDRYAQILTAAGFKLTRFDAPASHNLTQQDVDQAARWYQQHFPPGK